MQDKGSRKQDSSLEEFNFDNRSIICISFDLQLGEYRLAKPYRDILRYGDSVLRYVLNKYWIASKGTEMDF